MLEFWNLTLRVFFSLSGATILASNSIRKIVFISGFVCSSLVAFLYNEKQSHMCN